MKTHNHVAGIVLIGIALMFTAKSADAHSCEPKKEIKKSTVCAEGTVHSEGTATVIYLDTNGNFLYSEEWDTLKIIRPNGSKVNADCKNTGMACAALEVGDAAIGCATCTNGWCSWDQLDFN